MDVGHLHILTGAPGTGKTTVLERLDPAISRSMEPAREILAWQRAIGGTGVPDRDPSRFVELLLQRSIESHERAVRRGGRTVFDRGIPDCVAYAAVLGVDPTPSATSAEASRYASDVLLFEPWEEIYSTDDERTMTFGDVLVFHDEIVSAFERARYTLVPVPRGSVGERAAFVQGIVEASSSATADPSS